VATYVCMGGHNTNGAGVSLAVLLARDARDTLDELRGAIRRDSVADAVRALRNLFNLSEDQVERLSRDMSAQQIGALPYIRQLLARRSDELEAQQGGASYAEHGHA